MDGATPGRVGVDATPGRLGWDATPGPADATPGRSDADATPGRWDATPQAASRWDATPTPGRLDAGEPTPRRNRWDQTPTPGHVSPSITCHIKHPVIAISMGPGELSASHGFCLSAYGTGLLFMHLSAIVDTKINSTSCSASLVCPCLGLLPDQSTNVQFLNQKGNAAGSLNSASDNYNVFSVHPRLTCLCVCNAAGRWGHARLGSGRDARRFGRNSNPQTAAIPLG